MISLVKIFELNMIEGGIIVDYTFFYKKIGLKGQKIYIQSEGVLMKTIRVLCFNYS